MGEGLKRVMWEREGAFRGRRGEMQIFPVCPALPLHFVDLCSFPCNEISNDQSLLYILRSALIGLRGAASARLLQPADPRTA